MHLVNKISFAVAVLAASASTSPTPTDAEASPNAVLPAAYSDPAESTDLEARAESAELEARSEDGLVKRAGCGFAYGNVNNAVACMNYLYGLGTRNCVAAPFQSGGTVMCRSGNMEVKGVGLGSTASSYCSDVARAVQWVLDHCTQGDQTAGEQSAWGNGNLIVYVNRAG